MSSKEENTGLSAGETPRVPTTVSSTTSMTEAERNLERHEVPFFRFALTGGPCGGKTTGMARVFSFLRERGFDVITVPEPFGLVRSNGLSLDFFQTEGMGEIVQEAVLDTQMSMESNTERILRARGKPSVSLSDRGSMDSRVYVSPEEFEKIMKRRNTNLVELRDHRYDAVFHLVTAADGAAHAYSLENNWVRTETPEQAILMDRKTQKAWIGHPHFFVIDNTTNFEGKMTRLIDIISKIVGLPSNLKRRSVKFLLRSPPNLESFPPDISYQLSLVQKVYLKQSGTDKDEYRFVRSRTSLDANNKEVGSVYQLTVAKKAGDELIERKRIISQREYMSDSTHNKDPHRHVVHQKRVSFLYNHQSFSIHMYTQPVTDLCILHAQVEAGPDGKDAEVDLPPFLEVERQLKATAEDEDAYGAYSLSLIK